MADMNEMRDVWQKFRNGDHVTDKELQEMRKQLTNALPFLRAFPEGAAVRKLAVQDLDSIDRFLQARKEDASPRAINKRRF